MDDPLTICRLCMNAGVLKNIFNGGDTNFSEKIMSCLDIKLELDDGLPDKICESCERNIHNFYNFKHKCTEVDTKLRSLKVLKIENYDDTETEYLLKSECNIYKDALSDWLSDNDAPNLENLLITDINENPKNLIYPNLNELKLKLGRKRRKQTKLVLEVASHNEIKLNQKVTENSNNYLEENGCNSDGLPTKKPELALHTNLNKLKLKLGRKRRKQTKLVLEVASHNEIKLNQKVTENLNNYLEENGCNSDGLHTNLNELKLKLGRKRRKQTKLVLEVASHNEIKLNHKITKKNSNNYLQENGCNSDGLPTKKPELALQCEFCGQVFNKISLFNQHLVHHTGKKPYSCEICSKTFTRKDHKMVHMRSHSGLRPFICNICGKSSTKRQDLFRHMRIHSEEKKYSCPRCDRKFKRSGDVHSHMRSHTGVRPYSCDLCVKSYSSHSALTKHYRNNCRKVTTGK